MLIEIVATPRDPDGGCPWDLEQTFKTIAPYTLEEAYEVADTIQNNDIAALKDELDNLLLQVVYHARMAKEDNMFDFSGVVKSISNKMIQRHPHVLGDADLASAEAQTRIWEEIKTAERKDKSLADDNTQTDHGPESVLDSIPTALPALVRPQKPTARVARIGFDWQEAEHIYAKFDEEVAGVKQAVAEGDPEAITDELGDVLFVVANLCRKFNVNPEAALAGANQKLTNCFNYTEKAINERGPYPHEMYIANLDNLWGEAKAHESAKSRK